MSSDGKPDVQHAHTASFSRLTQQIIQKIMDWYRPGAVILQCGADSLAEDKLGCFNLSMRGATGLPSPSVGCCKD